MGCPRLGMGSGMGLERATAEQRAAYERLLHALPRLREWSLQRWSPEPLTPSLTKTLTLLSAMLPRIASCCPFWLGICWSLIGLQHCPQTSQNLSLGLNLSFCSGRLWACSVSLHIVHT